MLGSREIEANDILQLLGKARVIGDFEGPHQMRLQAMRPPDPAHGGVTHPKSLGQRSLAPLCRLGWATVQCALHDQFFNLSAVGRLTAASRRIVLEPYS